MTILEKRSKVRIEALKRLVKKGQYSPEFALGRLDEINIQGLLVAIDYDEMFDYLSELMEEEEKKEQEVEDEIVEESVEDEQ